MKMKDESFPLAKVRNFINGYIETENLSCTIHRARGIFAVYCKDVCVAQCSIRFPSASFLRKHNQIYCEEGRVGSFISRFRLNTKNVGDMILLLKCLARHVTIVDKAGYFPTPTTPSTIVDQKAKIDIDILEGNSTPSTETKSVISRDSIYGNNDMMHLNLTKQNTEYYTTPVTIVDQNVKPYIEKDSIASTKMGLISSQHQNTKDLNEGNDHNVMESQSDQNGHLIDVKSVNTKANMLLSLPPNALRDIFRTLCKNESFGRLVDEIVNVNEEEQPKMLSGSSLSISDESKVENTLYTNVKTDATPLPLDLDIKPCVSTNINMDASGSVSQIVENVDYNSGGNISQILENTVPLPNRSDVLIIPSRPLSVFEDSKPSTLSIDSKPDVTEMRGNLGSQDMFDCFSQSQYENVSVSASSEYEPPADESNDFKPFSQIMGEFLGQGTDW